MRVLLKIISVLFLPFSITSLPVEEKYYDDDNTNTSQLLLNEYGVQNSRSGSTASTRNITSLSSTKEMGIVGDTSISLGRNGLADKSKLWPFGVIPVSVEGSYNSEQRELMILAMDTLDYWTCIRFIAYTGQDDYIAIVNIPNKGCNSSVGFQGGRQEIMLEAPKCFNKIGTVLHEMLHAIGLIDEHRRPDRDGYVLIHEGNIRNGEEEYFKKYTQSSTYDYGVPYDYNSVMHFPELQSSRNGLITIEPIMPGETIGQRDGMSVRDAIKVANMYRCFYEIDTTLNYSKVLPVSNETMYPRDLLMVLYFNEKMNRN